MNYESTFVIRNKTLAKLTYFLNNEPKNADECFNENLTMSFSVKFKNGRWIEIIIYGKEYEEGQSNRAWVQAILYARNGAKLATSGKEHRLEGVWTLQHNGDLYIAYVVPEDKEDPHVIMANMTNRQKMWFRAMLQNAAREHAGFASNMHLAAMGATTQEESVQFETASDEARDFANKLNKLMSCLND